MDKKPQYDDPFRPKLNPETSSAVKPSEDQLYNIRRVLETACSDSRFVQKAYAAIVFILTNDPNNDYVPTPEPLFIGSQNR